jgi:selenocysteine lyase/cysteine desulfurase
MERAQPGTCFTTAHRRVVGLLGEQAHGRLASRQLLRRIGFIHYNTQAAVDRLLEALAGLRR